MSDINDEILKKYIFLDIWGTLFINNRESNLNQERAKIIYNITKYKNIAFWEKEIEDEIKKFKIKESNGISLKPIKRIKHLLEKNNIVINKANLILNEFDNLIINKYKPKLNKRLLDELMKKNDNIILISNTGLTRKKCIIKILNDLKIENIFLDMFFSEDYNYCKPNLLFYLIPIQKYNLNIENIIMYGDSQKMDFEPCQKLGIKCVIKNWREYI